LRFNGYINGIDPPKRATGQSCAAAEGISAWMLSLVTVGTLVTHRYAKDVLTQKAQQSVKAIDRSQRIPGQQRASLLPSWQRTSECFEVNWKRYPVVEWGETPIP